MKYFVKTFGCQMNEADSERITTWYESRGWKRAKDISEADEIIINTCSVRESAEHRVMGLLQKFKIQNSKFKSTSQKLKVKKQKIILTGCMLYHPLSWLKKKMPQVDEFKPIKEFVIPSGLYNRHAELISASPRGEILKQVRDDIKYVSIMEGCDNFCTYCVVPYSRGKQQSRPFKEIVCEVKESVKRGTKEIMLLGQNVNSYGKDFSTAEKQTPFAALLRVIHDIEEIKKISFLTSNPWDLDDEIIEAMKLPKVDRYLHLPVQSGDDEILRRMNRKYTAKNYLELVRKIKKAIPDIKIGTDVIVGFPGETEKQFQNTVKLCKKAGFVKVYIARYSPRPQTSAFKLKDDIFPSEKKRRWQILEKLINKKPKAD